MGPVILFIQSNNGAPVWSSQSRAAILSLAERLGCDEKVSLIQGFPAVLKSLGPVLEKIVSKGDLPLGLSQAVSSSVSADGLSAIMALVTKGPPESRDVMMCLICFPFRHHMDF
jgi:hypothetical protein